MSLEAGAGAPLARYAAWRRAGDFIFLSGIIPVNPLTGTIVNGFQDVPEPVRELLGAAGEFSTDAKQGPILAQSWYVLESIRRTGQLYGDQIRRVFLADGDALVLPTRRLLSILEAIRIHMPAVRRISSYCLPRNLRKKSQADIDELAAAGLTMAYVGAESGDDAVLAAVSKGETFDTTCEALDKLGTAGITRSVMILNGLGGTVLSEQHADNSARLMNAAQPEFLSTLVVSFPMGEARFREGFADFQPLGQQQLFLEVERLLQGLELQNTVFRSDHASNYLVLKGNLGADKARLLAQARQLPPVIWAVSCSAVLIPSLMRSWAASISFLASRLVRAGPFHAQAVYALRIAGSAKKPGAAMRPRATASANHSS